MTDWTNCPAVERHPSKISGDWAFTGTRVPVYALFENLEGGATVKEFLKWYPEVKEWQVIAVLKHEADSIKTAVQARKSCSTTGRRHRYKGTSKSTPWIVAQRKDGSCSRTGF
ncbi:MAG: DUF433 domain-containing protein [Boseongicola sp.]|nr:DUF433 domain-containing protein [Boseongicola sp.]